MRSKLTGIREATQEEKADYGCDHIFYREDEFGKCKKILVSKPSNNCSWIQWGQSKEILGDNVYDVDNFYKSGGFNND